MQENAIFQCKLLVAEVGADVWAYNIRVEVTGKIFKYFLSGKLCLSR